MARVKNESRFVGRAWGYWGRSFAVSILTILTFGIAGPWLICWYQRWVIGNTKIDGQSLYFDGTGWQLVGTWIKWMLLLVITCGLFLFWLPKRITNWSVKHTHFTD